MSHSLRTSAVVATITLLPGIVAVAFAAAWDAVANTSPESGWRQLQGTFVFLSLGFAAVGMFASFVTVASVWRSRAGALGAAGFILAVATLSFWVWMSQHAS